MFIYSKLLMMFIESGTLLKYHVSCNFILKYCMFYSNSLRNFKSVFLLQGKRKFGNLHVYLIWTVKLVKVMLRCLSANPRKRSNTLKQFFGNTISKVQNMFIENYYMLPYIFIWLFYITATRKV